MYMYFYIYICVYIHLYIHICCPGVFGAVEYCKDTTDRESTVSLLQPSTMFHSETMFFSAGSTIL